MKSSNYFSIEDKALFKSPLPKNDTINYKVSGKEINSNKSSIYSNNSHSFNYNSIKKQEAQKILENQIKVMNNTNRSTLSNICLIQKNQYIGSIYEDKKEINFLNDDITLNNFSISLTNRQSDIIENKKKSTNENLLISTNDILKNRKASISYGKSINLSNLEDIFIKDKEKRIENEENDKVKLKKHHSTKSIDMNNISNHNQNPIILPNQLSERINEEITYEKDENEEKNSNLLSLYKSINDINVSKSFLYDFFTKPIPRGLYLQTNMRRDNKGINKSNPIYYIYLNDNSNKLLMSAIKLNKATSSYYLITMSSSSFEKDENFLGKLRSNFFGSEYYLYDNGCNNKKSDNMKITRNIISSIEYETNILGLSGPRKFKIYIPNINESNEYISIKDDSDKSKLIKLGQKESSEVIPFKNKLPQWNERLKSYCLDFNNRVKKASIKNFQICDLKNENLIFLQFGKQGEDVFSLDFKYPFSPLQAFGISLSSLDNKKACE